MTVTAAIDIGYRNTKIVHQRHGAAANESHFPSIAVPAQAQAATGAALARRNTRLVEVDGQEYEVGPDAHLLLGPRSTQVLHEDYIHTPEYRALLLGGLSYIGEPRIDVLVGGLPVRHLGTGQARLEALMAGPHTVPGIGSVSIGRVVVIPQPLGGLIHHLRRPGAAAVQQTTLLVDPGFFTLDWTCAEGLKYLPAMTGSFPAGIASGLQAAAEHISEVIDTPFGDLDTLDRKMRQPEIRIAGRVVDRARLEEKIREALQPGIMEMRNRIGGALSIDRIVVCGGGAAYYAPLIREAWPHHPVAVVDEPLMANVRGFHSLASSAMAGSRQEVAA